MIKHMIIWKLNNELTDAQKAKVKADAKAGLEGLLGKIDGLTTVTVFTEALPSSNGDMMLDTTFTDKAALDAYRVASAHVAVANGVIRPNVSIRLCMDFEV